MKLWREWPRWLKAVAAVLVPGIGALTYLVMVNVVLKPRVILEVRSEVAGIEVWIQGRKLGVAPFETDVSDYFSRAKDLSFWDSEFWWNGSSVGRDAWGIRGTDRTYFFSGTWSGSVGDLGDGAAQHIPFGILLSARSGATDYPVLPGSQAVPEEFRLYWSRIRRIPVMIYVAGPKP